MCFYKFKFRVEATTVPWLLLSLMPFLPSSLTPLVRVVIVSFQILIMDLIMLIGIFKVCNVFLESNPD